jgi:plastocyanin
MSTIFRIAGAVVLISSVFLVCASARPRKVRPSQFAAVHQPAVVMINGSLDPQVLKVKQGTTVEWINNSDRLTVAASDASFKSGVLKPGENFQHTFQKRGRYSYRCESGRPGGEISGTIVVTR